MQKQKIGTLFQVIVFFLRLFLSVRCHGTDVHRLKVLHRKRINFGQPNPLPNYQELESDHQLECIAIQSPTSHMN